MVIRNILKENKMKDIGKPELEEGEEIKTRSKEYTERVIDITDIDSQLICKVFNYNTVRFVKI